MDKSELIYDWNLVGRAETGNRPLELNDETLRDGLQSPSVIDPPIEKKIEIIHLMDSLGIDTADIGLPGAGPRAVADVTRLAKEIADCKLDIRPNCAARTVLADIQPIVDISEKVGIPIEACTFIGSSPIRQYTEDWPLEMMLTATEDAVSFAVSHGLRGVLCPEKTNGSQSGYGGSALPGRHRSRGPPHLRLRHGRSRDARRGARIDHLCQSSHSGNGTYRRGED